MWTLAGLAYGMVELIRRVMCVQIYTTLLSISLMLLFSPADIVGSHVGKLRRMDATVVRLIDYLLPSLSLKPLFNSTSYTVRSIPAE